MNCLRKASAVAPRGLLYAAALLLACPPALATHSQPQTWESPPLFAAAADWSYACIDYVSGLSDPRNLGTAAVYLALLWLAISARPWEVPLEWAGRRAPVRPAYAVSKGRVPCHRGCG